MGAPGTDITSSTPVDPVQVEKGSNGSIQLGTPGSKHVVTANRAGKWFSINGCFFWYIFAGHDPEF
jgi:hypothetical protein